MILGAWRYRTTRSTWEGDTRHVYDQKQAIRHTQPPATTTASASTTHAETIHTTANHPWLTADRGWVQAGDLNAGEQVVTLNCAAGMVAWVHIAPCQADIYNLTVAHDHTYAVGDGQAVVHNDDGPFPGLTPSENAQNWRYAPGTVWGGSHLLSTYSVANPHDYFVLDGGTRILVPREVAQAL